MDNKIYPEALVGMTISIAERFINENIVYFDETHTTYRIMKIRKMYYGVPDTLAYYRDRLNVRTKNDVIVEILEMG